MNSIIKDIYLISCKDSNQKGCYVGQTSRFKRRLIEHKHVSKTESASAHNRSIYRYIRNHGGWDNFEMKKIHSIEGTQKEIDKLEKFYIKKYKSLNTIPTRTRKEYYKDNKETINAKSILYYNEHRDEFLEKKKEVCSCHCGGTYTRTHRARHMKSNKHFNNIFISQV